MFFNMGYVFPLLQWLLRTVYNQSAPDYPTVLEIRVPIPQSASVSDTKCSPEDIIEPQGVSPKHLMRVQWDLNQGNTLANPFERFIHLPVAPAQKEESGVFRHCHP